MMSARTITLGVHRVTDDPSWLDMDLAHAALSERSYWARGRARETTEILAGGVVWMQRRGPTT